jgi:hypothetical protein
MFHPKRTPPPVQQQQSTVHIAAVRDVNDSHDATASASPALLPHTDANAVRSVPHHSPSLIPAHLAAAAPSPLLPMSSTSPPETPVTRPPLQHHRVTQVQLVRSSGNITVKSAVPAVSSSISSRANADHSSSIVDEEASAAVAAAVPAPDVSAALAEQLMAKMQVETKLQWDVARISLTHLMQLEFNARLEAERDMFAKQMMAMQQQMQQQQLQQQQQFESMLKVPTACTYEMRCMNLTSTADGPGSFISSPSR